MGNKINNIKKVVSLIIIMAIFIILACSIKVEAASFSITSGISSTTVGSSYTIKISAEGLTGRFNITHSSNVSVNVNSVWVENGVVDSTIKVTTKAAGKATVTVTPETVADSAGNDVSLSAKTDTVTVNAKSSSSSNSSNNNSNSSSNNSTSNNNTASNAPRFSSVNETVYATASVNIRSSYSTSSSVIGSLDVGDSVTRTGKATSSVNGITWSRVTYNGQTAYISSDYLTTEKPEESNNKDLKDLTIEGDYTLTPEFSKDVTEYDLTVGEDVESIKINAVADDDAAKVEVTGNDKLLMGTNTVEIKVTAEDGTEKTYKINVTKGKVEQITFGLSELTVQGFTLSPVFSSDVYEYTLDITDLSVTSLNINAVANEENATVEITGDDELQQGENVITILVKSEDGENTVTYQITANIHEAVAQTVEENNDNNMLLYGGIALAVIVIIVVIVIVRHNRNKYDDYETYFGGVKSSDDDDDDYNSNEQVKVKTLENNTNTENDIKSELNFANINNNDKSELNFNNINSDDEKIEKNFKSTKDEIKSELNFDKLNNLDIKPDLNFKAEENKSMDSTIKDKKSIIEENFGDDIKLNKFDDDQPRKRKGKHF